MPVLVCRPHVGRPGGRGCGDAAGTAPRGPRHLSCGASPFDVRPHAGPPSSRRAGGRRPSAQTPSRVCHGAAGRVAGRKAKTRAVSAWETHSPRCPHRPRVRKSRPGPASVLLMVRRTFQTIAGSLAQRRPLRKRGEKKHRDGRQASGRREAGWPGSLAPARPPRLGQTGLRLKQAQDVRPLVSPPPACGGVSAPQTCPTMAIPKSNAGSGPRPRPSESPPPRWGPWEA